MQSVLIMTKEYDNYHAIQFYAENDLKFKIFMR